ncbi:hypothetical protein CFT12S00416_05465 [Campylobacter fetus subsp. testudinum]|uniref:hypothetical protein n=1 Tax=Campylobacter fetus TaxID=196 RepID=UPI000818B9D6|nr:hypothetical protein [Campylobacter fetus]OCR88873.1 hypothetical protein CFT12S00416_05465 [Campylobacter fetus subsp. testudinum]
MGGNFNIKYLQHPGANAKSGIGAGFASLGDSFAKLGEIGKKREEMDIDKAYKNADISIKYNTMQNDQTHKKNTADETKRNNDNNIKFKYDELGANNNHKNKSYNLDIKKLQQNKDLKEQQLAQTGGYYDYLKNQSKKEKAPKDVSQDPNYAEVNSDFYGQYQKDYPGMFGMKGDKIYVKKGFLGTIAQDIYNKEL